MKDVGQRIARARSGADRIDVGVHGRQRIFEMRAAGSKRGVLAGIQQIRQLLSEVGDGAAAEAGGQADRAGITFVDIAGSGIAGCADVLDEWKEANPKLVRRTPSLLSVLVA
jgi:hypothetical protein